MLRNPDVCIRGIEDWIHKPIDPDELLERIEAALG
jgi:DNA-binding response OmpR family regulator